MIKVGSLKLSLYITLGIIIFSTVVVILSLHSAYDYSVTKTNIVEEMQRSSKQSIIALEKNVSSLIASYAVNEYDKLIFTEMERTNNLAIIVEDYNMGKIIGKEALVSGNIRDADGNILKYDQLDSFQNQKLRQSFYAEKHKITGSNGEILGVISIYNSGDVLEKELNEIIIGSLVNTVLISLLLILSLFLAIRIFLLRPLSKIVGIINDTDEDGIPVGFVPGYGSKEICALADTMNNMIGTIRDSRVKLTEQTNEIIANKDQLRTLSLATEQSPVSILICSPDNIIEYANPQFEKTSGYEINEVVGISIESLFQYSEHDQKQVVEFKQTLASGDRWIGEMIPFTKDGDSYRIRMSASPILQDDGSVTHNIYVAEDITEQKRNEEMLRNSQKMDAIGQLTGGIAHDFNNLLGVIMGNLELLKMTFGNSPKELERIDNALASTKRGAQLTRKLLNFSRHDHKHQGTVKINPFIEGLYELIARSVTSAIQVKLHLAKNLWSVEIDSGDFEDALLNLSLNAKDAMPNGGLLVIETANKYLDANYVKQNPNVHVGEYVMITVSDTGIGISEENHKKIYDPFYTTKEFGKGTGLGLSMVYGFVQRSGGHIQIYSEVGKGSSFRLYLPRVVGEANHDAIEHQEDLPGGNETILIVDDEKALSLTAEGYLQQLGYRTFVANSAKEALDILSTTVGIDLIFSDVVMPEMDGFQLSFAALKQQPGIRLLLTSGFTSKRMEYSNGEQKVYLELSKRLLGKPYNLNELAFSVRRALDEPASL